MRTKELWFANYERALAEREFAGLKPKHAENLAADDADQMTRDQLANAADLARTIKKENP